MRFRADSEIVRVSLRGTEVCQCESDAVVTATGNTAIDGQMSGGVLAALARKLLTGETFFLTQLSSSDGAACSVVVAPKCPGDVVVLDELPHAGLALVQGAFLAASKGVAVESRAQRNLFNSAFSGTGFFTLSLTGTGPVAFAGFGKVFTHSLNADEELLVDNGHLVGWTADATFTMELASSRSIMSSVKSGEGLMCRFRGPGSIYIQSRNPDGYQEWLQSQLVGKGGGASTAQGCCAMLMAVLVMVVVTGLAAAGLSLARGVDWDSHEAGANNNYMANSAGLGHRRRA